MSYSKRRGTRVVDGVRRTLVSALSAMAIIFGFADCVLFFYAIGCAFRGDLDSALGAGLLMVLCSVGMPSCVFLADVVRGVFATGDEWQELERRRAWDGADR